MRRLGDEDERDAPRCTAIVEPRAAPLRCWRESGYECAEATTPTLAPPSASGSEVPSQHVDGVETRAALDFGEGRSKR